MKLCFGPFLFDPHRHELTRHGHRVSMSASQMRLLTLFLERRNGLVTREEIAACLWTDARTVDVTAGINTAVNRLRRNLQEAPGAVSPIETVFGLGYRFLPRVIELELANNGDEPSPEPVPLIVSESQDAVEASSARLDDGSTLAPEQGEAEGRSASDGFAQAPGRYGQAEATRTAYEPGAQPPEHAGSSPAWWSRHRTMTFLVCAMILLGAGGIVAWSHVAARHKDAPNVLAAVGPPAEPLLTRVTPDEDVQELTAAAVSPSGRFAAYADPYGVSVYTFATAEKRLLSTRASFTVDRLAWVPDESGVLMSGTDVSLQRQQVWFAPVSSPYAHLLMEDATRAVSSPDGGRIAFLRSGNRELWVAAAEGLHPRLLRSAGAGEVFDLVVWSPAGDRLLVTFHPANATPDSAADKDKPGGYEFLDAETGNPLHREEGLATSSGYLLADGRFFFIKNTLPGPAYFGTSLMVVPLELGSGRMLGTPRRLYELEAKRADSLSASLTGERTAAVLQRAAVDVFVADAKGGSSSPELSHVARLSRGGTQTFPHAWTADGTSILAEKDPQERTGAAARSSIYALPVDGSPPRLLASLPQNSAMAQLSPDGRWILFLEFTSYPQHVLGLFRIPADGGGIEQVPVTGEITEFRCSVSPAGRCVVRVAVGKEALVYYALDPVHGMGEEVGRMAWQPYQLGDWGLSPDGSTVAIATHDLLHPAIELLRLGTRPAQVREIAVQGHGSTLGAGWAPDGKSLFVECRTESGFELNSLDLAGKVKPLRKSQAMIWAIPSRDAGRIAFPDVTFSSSVWIISAKA